MKVCYFGVYNPNHIRNRVLIAGLIKNGVSVLECRDNSTGLSKYWNLYKKHKLIKNQYDIMVVGFSGQVAVFFAKLLTNKKVVLDAMVPLHDAMVYNHKQVKKISLKSLYYWLLDYTAVHIADMVMTDTVEHIKFYNKNFGLNKNKCFRIFVGADDSIFYPRKSNKISDKFVVEFHGFVYGEHGIDYIVEAAQILEKEDRDIQFNIIGASSQYDQAKVKAERLALKNIHFLGRKKFEEIPQIIADSDVCLGLFGITAKTKRVIPCKGFEIAASKRAYINVDGPGMRELFIDGENCLLCQPANAASLTRAILTLKNNPDLKDKIANNVHELFEEKLRPIILGKKLKDKLKNLL